MAIVTGTYWNIVTKIISSENSFLVLRFNSSQFEASSVRNRIN